MKLILFTLSLLLIIGTAWAGSADIDNALNEISTGKRPLKDLVLDFGDYSNIRGEVTLKITGTGKTVVRKICGHVRCNERFTDCHPTECTGKIAPNKIISLISLIRKGGILKMAKEYPQAPCDEQSILTIQVKNVGKFTTQMGRHYFNKQRGFAKLHTRLVQIINDLLEPEKEPFKGEEIEVPPAWRKH